MVLKEQATSNVALWLIAFMTKSLTSVEMHYSNIDIEALGINHGLEKLHHNCFTHTVRMIRDTNYW